MLRRLVLCTVALAATGSVAPAAVRTADALQSEVEPPEDMIDFLGRRRECASIAPEPGEVRPPPPPGSWGEWLRCPNLSAEELALRRRYAGDAIALAFLDQAPADFRLERIVATAYEGSSPVRVERAEQRGLDARGREPWHIVLDRQAAQGRTTSVSASWGAHPTRTIYLDNRMFPWLDLTSARVALRVTPDDTLSIEMRYGARRGWCGDIDRDDRSRVSVYFTHGGAEVFRQDRTNCNDNYDELEPGAFERPPHTQSR